MTDDRTKTGLARNDTLNMGEAWAHMDRPARSREISGRFSLEEIQKLNRWIKTQPGRRMTEEEAVLALVRKALDLTP